MVIWHLVRWWYGPGLVWAWRGVLVNKLLAIAEMFSVKEMITTLFAPFRQTYVGKAEGIAILQAFADRTLSRGIGFVVRTLLLIAAAVAAVFTLAISLALLLVWPTLPLLPLVSILLFVLGVGV